jgi:hypothetical protein
MKIEGDIGPVHEIIVEEAIRLLPETIQEELDGTPKRLIMKGAHDEDTTDGPLGQVDSDMSRFIGKVYGPAPWLEHYWDPTQGPDSKGYAGHRNARNRAIAYWREHTVNQYLSGFRELGWENLGRVCHLLADMCVPAHTHNDPHYNVIDVPDEMVPLPLKPLFNLLMNDDDFEWHVARIMQWDSRRWAAQPDHRIICNPGWPLGEMFRQVALRTAMYDSDDASGTGHGRPYRWGTFSRDFSGDLTDYACEKIGDDLLPLAFQATAGLIYRFMMETRQPLPAMTFAEVFFHELMALDVKDEGEGEVKLELEVNGIRKQIANDMRSGEAWRLDQYLCVEVKEGEPLIIRASAYDDDGWFLDPNAKDDMGMFDNRYWGPDWGSERWHTGGTPCFELPYRIGLHKVPARPRGRGFVVLPTMVGRVDQGYAPERDPEEEAPLVLNKGSKYVHRSNCPVGRTMHDVHRISLYMTPEEALRIEGSKRCRTCLKEA